MCKVVDVNCKMKMPVKMWASRKQTNGNASTQSELEIWPAFQVLPYTWNLMVLRLDPLQGFQVCALHRE